MARGKVQLKRIENLVHRQVTFCKRRAGLLKKAKELSILCDAEIGIMVFSAHGKLYELATKGSMDELIERYMKSTRGAQTGEAEAKLNLELQEEIVNLKQEIQLLHKGLGHIYGRRTEDMTLEELHALEEHLEIWMYQIRSTKTQIMFQEIQLLKNKINPLAETSNNQLVAADAKLNFDDNAAFRQKEIFALCDPSQEDPREEGILTAANGYLQGKILEQTGIVEMSPDLTGLSYPLNIQSEIFQS